MLNIYGVREKDKVEIDSENKTMTFTRTGLLGMLGATSFQYDMDGWAGRYGKPLELLLSLHISTMMPDLVYEFATHEDLQTLVNIKAEEVVINQTVQLQNTTGDTWDYVLRIEDIEEPYSGQVYIPEITISEDGEITINTEQLGNLIDLLKDKKISIEALGMYMQRSLESIKTNNLNSLNGTGTNGDLYIGNYINVSGESLADYNYNVDINTALQQIKSYIDADGDVFIVGEYSDDGVFGDVVSAHGVPGLLAGRFVGNASAIKQEINKNGEAYIIQDEYITAIVKKEGDTYILNYTYIKDSQKEEYQIPLIEIPGLRSYANEYNQWYPANGYDEKLIENCTYHVSALKCIDELIYMSIFYINGEYTNIEIDYPEILYNEYYVKHGDGAHEHFQNNEGEWCHKYLIQFFEMIELERDTYDDHGYETNNFKRATEEDMNMLINSIDNNLNQLKNLDEETLTNVTNTYYETVAEQLGLPLEGLEAIYTYLWNDAETQNEEIKTFAPIVKSVIKHWYKDIVFKYGNASYDYEKIINLSSETGEAGTEGLQIKYTYSSDDYPVQEEQPYVIKGDTITQDEQVVDSIDISEEDEQELNDILDGDPLSTSKSVGQYTLGEGYKVARKLFTQGYYYQYDGTSETTKEIVVAKKIETYNKDELIEIVVVNGRLHSVKPASESDRTEKTYTTVYNDVLDKDIEYSELIFENSKTEYYIVPAPGAYVSAADETGGTEESKERINTVLEAVGVDVRRKKVTMTSSVTSLTAFAMLENMHSLDADYVYREFKEFLIELGYYSRAELEQIETDKLDWFIPSYTPKEWPTNKEDITSFVTELPAYSTDVEITKLEAEKITSFDKFTLIEPVGSNQIDTSKLNEYVNEDYSISVKAYNLDTGSITRMFLDESNIGNNGIIFQYDASFVNSIGGENAASIIQTIIEGRLKDLAEENNTEMPIIYILKLLPVPNTSEDGESALNSEINKYNNEMMWYASNQEKVKFIDATEGYVTSSGYLSDNFSSTGFSEKIINEIIKKDVNNGGFKEGLTVITPGAGYITDISENEITIEFSATLDPRLKPVDGFSMIIKGIAVDTTLLQRYNNKIGDGLIIDEDGNVKIPVKREEVIGLTGTENIQLILRNKNMGILDNIEDYMPVPEIRKYDVEMESLIEFIWFFEGVSGPDDGSGYYTVQYPDDDDPTVGHGVTAGTYAIFQELGYGEYVAYDEEKGEYYFTQTKIPVNVADEVSKYKIINDFENIKEQTSSLGLNWGDNQCAAYASLEYNGYTKQREQILQYLISGDYAAARQKWLDCVNWGTNYEFGHKLRRSVEWDLFETGNAEVSEDRKYECYEKYKQYHNDY